MSDLFDLMMSMDDTPVVREFGCTRAPFGYPGGKGDSAKHIHPHLPYRDGYCEVFGGSGILLLQREPVDLEIFNDRFSGVTSFYRVLRDPLKVAALMNRLALIVHSREEFEWCRDTWTECEDVERAARWWSMHQMSFSKQARHFGRSTRGKNSVGHALRSNLQWFEPAHRRLKGVIVENQDWRNLFKDYDHEGMVWYLDPPYVRYAKGKYEHEFTKKDHAEMCERIFRLKGHVVLSGYGDPETREIYDAHKWDEIVDWEVFSTMAPYAFTDTNNLAGNEHCVKRQKVTEMLWIKEAG
jgi:DNA adenine methylase